MGVLSEKATDLAGAAGGELCKASAELINAMQWAAAMGNERRAKPMFKSQLIQARHHLLRAATQIDEAISEAEKPEEVVSDNG